MAFLFWNEEEQRFRALWRLLLQIVVMIFCLVMTSIVTLIKSDGNSPLHFLALTVGIVASVWIAGRMVDKRRFADFGVHLNSAWWKDLGFGLALGAFLMAAIFAVELACGWITITSVLKGASSGDVVYRLAMAALLFIGVGIHEEFMSRGYHLKNLAEGFKPLGTKFAIVLSVLLSSAVFGLMHAGNPNASTISTFNIFLAGVFLALGYILTGELGISIGLHITWNFFQGPVFGFPVSGGSFGPSIFGIQQGGSDTVTGGAFGPEAGLIGLGAMLLGALLILGWVKLRKGQIQLQARLTEPELLSDTF